MSGKLGVSDNRLSGSIARSSARRDAESSTLPEASGGEPAAHALSVARISAQAGSELFLPIRPALALSDDLARFRSLSVTEFQEHAIPSKPRQEPQTNEQRVAAQALYEEEQSKLKDYFAELSPEAKFELLVGAIETHIEKDRLDNLNLALLKSFAQGELRQLEDPTTWGGSIDRNFESTFNRFGIDQAHGEQVRSDRDSRRAIFQAVIEEELPRMAQRCSEGEILSSLTNSLHPQMRVALENANIDSLDFFSTNPREDQFDVASKVLRHQRSNKDYGQFEESAFIVFRREFEEQFADKLSGARQAELRNDAAEYVTKLVETNRKNWEHPSAEMIAQGAAPLSAEQIAGISEALQAERYRSLELREIASIVDPTKFVGKQREVWELYNDVMDPQGEWLNLADKTQDRICEEVAVSLPLILASGGTAAVARAGLSAAGRVAVGRVLAHQAIKDGAAFTVKELAVEGGAWAAKTLSRRLFTAAVGLGLEGSAFEMAHVGLQGQWIGNLPDGLERVAFAALTLGTIRGANQLADRAFRRVLQEGGKVVLDETGAEVVKLTRLGRAVDQISNPAARTLAEQLILKGHVAAASLLVIGAAREGYYQGDLRSALRSVDTEAVFETYMRLGAINLSQRGMKAVRVADTRVSATKPLASEPIAGSADSRSANNFSPNSNRVKIKQSADTPLTDIALSHPSLGGRPLIDILTNPANQSVAATNQHSGSARFPRQSDNRIGESGARGGYTPVLPGSGPYQVAFNNSSSGQPSGSTLSTNSALEPVLGVSGKLKLNLSGSEAPKPGTTINSLRVRADRAAKDKQFELDEITLPKAAEIEFNKNPELQTSTGISVMPPPAVPRPNQIDLQPQPRFRFETPLRENGLGSGVTPAAFPRSENSFKLPGRDALQFNLPRSAERPGQHQSEIEFTAANIGAIKPDDRSSGKLTDADIRKLLPNGTDSDRDPLEHEELVRLVMQIIGEQSSVEQVEQELEKLALSQTEIDRVIAEINGKVAEEKSEVEADSKRRPGEVSMSAEDLMSLPFDGRMKALEQGEYSQQLRKEVAIGCANQKADRTAEKFQTFGLTDQADIKEVALECAKQNGRATVKYFRTFGLTDQADIKEVALVCAKQDGRVIAIHLRTFGLTDQADIKEVALECARQNGTATVKYFQTFGLTDQADIKEVVLECAKQDGYSTAQNFQTFGLTDQADIKEVVLECAKQDGDATAQRFQTFGLTDQADAKEVALECAKQNGCRTAVYFQTFGLTDQADIKEVALECAKQDGGETAKNFRTFGLTDHADIKEVALECFKQDGAQTARNFQTFGLSDQAVIKQLALLFADADPKLAALVFQNFGLTDQADVREVLLTCLTGRLPESLSLTELAMQRARDGWFLELGHVLAAFPEINREPVVAILNQGGKAALVDSMAANFVYPPYEGKRALGEVRFTDFELVKTLLSAKAPKDRTNQDYRQIWEKIKESATWNEQQGVTAQFEVGANAFGYKELLAYSSAADVSRHDAVIEMSAIVRLYQQLADPDIYTDQTAPAMGPQDFVRNILVQVAQDNSAYDDGKSYHQLNSIAQRGFLAPRALLQKVLTDDTLKNDAGLIQRVQSFQTPADVLGSWRQLKQYCDLSYLIQHETESLKQIAGLRSAGRIQHADYFQKVAFSPGSNVNLQSLLQMFNNPIEFLGAGDLHAAPEHHDSKKPSNYVHIPHLGLTAEQLVDALVEGKLDRIQALSPYSVAYEFAADGKKAPSYPHTTAIRQLVVEVLGSRREQKAGLLANGAAAALFQSLQAEINSGQVRDGNHGKVNFADFLSGKHQPSEETVAALRGKIFQALTDANLIESRSYVVQVHKKSSPEAVLAGNRTACCMPFGSGKMNVYMFNPNCVQLTVQLLNADGTPGRTVAQSVLTLDMDAGKKVPDLLQAFQASGHVAEIVSQDVLANSKRFVVCDSIETDKNFIESPASVQQLRTMYEDFLQRYLQSLPETLLDGHELVKNRVFVSTSFPGPFAASYPKEDNTYVQLAPTSYSDNTGGQVFVLTPKATDSVAIPTEVAHPAAPASEKRGRVSDLTYRDSLHISVLEGKIYADNQALIVSLHNLENALIAKDIANEQRGIANLSLKYLDRSGMVQGYLLAYEGKVGEDAEDLQLPGVSEGDKIIYISDFAALNRGGAAAGKILLEFIDRYKTEYLKHGQSIPIYMEAREGTSYELVLNQLPQLQKRLGVEIEMTELGTYQDGTSKMHRLLLSPRTQPSQAD